LVDHFGPHRNIPAAAGWIVRSLKYSWSLRCHVVMAGLDNGRLNEVELCTWLRKKINSVRMTLGNFPEALKSFS